MLYRCLEAVWQGVEPPRWFNAAIVVCISKATLSAEENEYRASPGQYRPLTLANSCQKLIAKVFNGMLETVTVGCVSPLQRGFVRGRSIVDNVLEVEASAAEYLYDGEGDPGIFLFDVAAAFPLAAQRWIWRLLEEMEVPLPLRRGMQLLYMHSFVRFLVGGKLPAQGVLVCSGIKQGCPASGSVRALLYGTAVRLLSSVMDTASLAVGCFADDLAAAARRVAETLPLLLCAFALVRRATRLAVNVRKTKLVYFGERLPEVAAEMTRLASGESMTVARSGVYLGVPLGRQQQTAIGTESSPRLGAPLAMWLALVSLSRTECKRTACLGSRLRA